MLDPLYIGVVGGTLCLHTPCIEFDNVTRKTCIRKTQHGSNCSLTAFLSLHINNNFWNTPNVIWLQFSGHLSGHLSFLAHSPDK